MDRVHYLKEFFAEWLNKGFYEDHVANVRIHLKNEENNDTSFK